MKIIMKKLKILTLHLKMELGFAWYVLEVDAAGTQLANMQSSILKRAVIIPLPLTH
jgi:hypothetical protein